MSTIFTMPGKRGDAILQFPVVHHYAQQTGEKVHLWLDEKSLAPLVPLFEAQPCVEAVKLIGGIEAYNCGGQPFHFDLPTSAFVGNTVFHLGLRQFPVRQLTLQALQDSKVPISVDPETLAETPTLEVGDVTHENRLLIHGTGVCVHNGASPTMWRFLASVREELESMFDSIEFVGSPDDLEVGTMTYPDWKAFDDKGDMLAFARHVAGSRAFIGVGSFPVTVAGALKVPAIRVHDRIGNDCPKVIWSNLGASQVNDTHIELRKSWPVFRDRWLSPVDAAPTTA